MSVNPVLGASSYKWTIIPTNTDCGCVTNSSGLITCPTGVIFPKFTANNSSTFTTTGTTASINWGNCKGNYTVSCTPKNICGDGMDAVKSVYVYNSNNGGYNPCPTTLKISPNPVKDGELNISLRITPGRPCNNFNGKQIIKNDVVIYDMFGNKVYSNTYTSDDFSIKNMNLKKGNYIINVLTSGGDNHKQVFVVE